MLKRNVYFYNSSVFFSKINPNHNPNKTYNTKIKTIENQRNKFKIKLTHTPEILQSKQQLLRHVLGDF